MFTKTLPEPFLSLSLILLVSLFIPPMGHSKSPADPAGEITRAVEDLYIKGLKTRDFSLIEAICIPDTKLMSINRDDRLSVTTLDKWSKRFDPSNPPFESLEYEITRVDFKGAAAQVRIDFIVDSSREVTDYLHLLRIEGKWRIVNIIDD